MATKQSKVYWDSCVFIDGHKKTPGRIQDIERIEEDARAGGVRIYASTLAIAEVVKIGKRLLTEKEERQIRDYFENRWVTLVPVDRPVAKLAAKIVRDHAIKPPDAVHIATALRTNVDALHTYDLNSGMLGLDKRLENGLRIVKPEQYRADDDEGNLFAPPN